MATARSLCHHSRLFRCCLVPLLLRIPVGILGQFIPTNAVQKQTSAISTQNVARGLAIPEDARIPAVPPVASGRTVFGIRPLVGHTVATATGAVRGAASRVGDAIGAAMAASSMTRNPWRYAHERTNLQQALANYPLFAPYATPGTRATVSHLSAVPQAASAPGASSVAAWNEAYLAGMERKPALNNALNDFQTLSSTADAAYIPTGDGHPTATVAMDPSQPPPVGSPSLRNQADISLLPTAPLGTHSSSASPALPPADFQGVLVPTAHLPPVPDSVGADFGRHTKASGLSEVARSQTASPPPGFASLLAQTIQQAVSGIPSNSLPRQQISIHDALSLAEKVVVPSIEAIAKVAPGLPLAREAEKLRGKLSNKNEESAQQSNAPPAQEFPTTKIERRPRLYIP